MTSTDDVTRSQISMLILGVLVGIIAGLGSILFRWMIGLFHNLSFYGHFSVDYAAKVHSNPSPLGAWIIAVPVVGAIIVAFLVQTFAPEAKGHGVPEVMDAIHHKQGRIRPIVAVIKSIASSISIGTGGSIGREGPIVQIGASFGSCLGYIVNMTAGQRVILIAAGAGAGIAATFNAPLGGFAFAIELMLLSISAVTLLPVAASIVVATYISRLTDGLHTMLGVGNPPIPTHAIDPWGLTLAVVFGLVMGLMSLLFIQGIYWFEDRFNEMPGNYYTRHIIGMTLVGIMMYAFVRFSGHYYIQGVGYATIYDIITHVMTNPWFLLLLLAAKFLATCLTLGSGASGGIFSPSLYMGATLGCLFGLFVHQILPDANIPVIYFSLAGMAAMVCGCTGAIITSIAMVSELTHDYNSILFMIMACSVAYAVRKAISNESIYTLKLLRRGSYLPEGLESAINAAKTARHYMSESFEVVQERTDINVSSKPYCILPIDNGFALFTFDKMTQSAHCLCKRMISIKANTPYAQLVEHHDEQEHIGFCICNAKGEPIGVITGELLVV